MPSAEPLLEIADGLYALDPGAFTAARDAAAKEHRGDKELAGRVKKLKKPSLAAWAVNLLVRREGEQIEQVLALGESLRAAAQSLDGAELRALTRQRRQLTAALTGTARALVREYAVRLTATVADQVEDVLNAALLDPVAAEVVQSGLLVSAFTSTGVSEVDVATVCAVPEAVGNWTARAITAAEAPAQVAGEVAGQRRPQFSVVPDTAVRLAEARERVADAAAAVAQAGAAVDEGESSVRDLQARRLQLVAEIDELQRRISVLEQDVEQVDEDIEDAESAHSEAVEALAEARREQDDAEKETDRLQRKAAAETAR